MSNSTNVTSTRTSTRVVIATTIALTFISVSKAAAVVLADLASSMFYAGGIAEQAFGRSAPWLIVGVMVFSFAVRAVYTESCSMFVRGGVYAVVRDSMGPLVAKISVSALIFDYLLTGPISGVSAGQYAGRLLNECSEFLGLGFVVNPDLFSMWFAAAITAYFWWLNTKGIHESSHKALRIMQVTTVMVAVLLLWAPLTLILGHPATVPPLPTPENLTFGHHSLGWLEGTVFPQIATIAFIIAFGHSFLSMSGFETLAQVYREIAYPKLSNLKKTGLIVCTYALVSTGIITLWAGIIIPDAQRTQYLDNLIGGLVMNLAGPTSLKLIFHAFVVFVGGLILSGAVNTSIIGANSVLNRVAEDGVLLDWFRKPHTRFGTTSRMINTVVLLQLLTIFMSRGDVYALGEAYAFGVVWSFALKSTGVLVLRFQRKDQEYKTPLNVRFRGVEIPLGLFITQLILFAVAIVNLFTKQHATIYGLTFTTVFFVLFTISEAVNKRHHAHAESHLERFNLSPQDDLSPAASGLPSAPLVVAVRDYTSLKQLDWVLGDPRYRKLPIVVLTIRPLSVGEGEYDLSQEQIFSQHEKTLMTKVVSVAEKAGMTVSLLVVPAVNYSDGIVRTAMSLGSTMVVMGASPRVDTPMLAHRLGAAWENLPEPKVPLSLFVVGPEESVQTFELGPHAPRLWREDVERVHSLWRELGGQSGIGHHLHHRDVVSIALSRLAADMRNGHGEEITRQVEAVLAARSDKSLN